MHTGSSLVSYEQCAIGFSKIDNADLLKLYYNTKNIFILAVNSQN